MSQPNSSYRLHHLFVLSGQVGFLDENNSFQPLTGAQHNLITVVSTPPPIDPRITELSEELIALREKHSLLVDQFILMSRKVENCFPTYEKILNDPPEKI